MANLSELQIRELFEVPRNRKALTQCAKHHERLRLHNEPTLDNNDVSPALKDFKEWVASFLPKDKHQTFCKLLTLPVPTVDLTANIFEKLKRSLQGENGYTEWLFSAEEYSEDFAKFREKTKEEQFWKEKGWEAFKSAINSVLIVDVPAVQSSERPEPYFYLLDVSRVYDAEVKADGQLDYIIFTEGTNKRFVFDDSFYRTYERTDETQEFKLISQVQHSEYTETGEKLSGIGYCPARMFWSTTLGSSDKLQRKNVLTSALSKLDKLIFWEISKEYYQTYGTYPIYWEYANECEYSDAEGNECNEGFITRTVKLNTNGSSKEQQEVELQQVRCPKCSENDFLGPGSVKTIDPPADNSDADLREPVGIVKVDIDALKFVEEAQATRKAEIFTNAVGTDEEPKNDQAKNEKQVKSSFESKRDVLLHIKENFDKARHWANETVCLIRYGAEYISSTVIYGDEFYLVNEAELAEQYKNDKAAGLPMYHLAMSREILFQTKFKNNPELLNRVKILSFLEPYPDFTIAELLNLHSKGADLVNPEALALKVNFDNYVKKFEAEQMDVVRFGKLTTFKNKIQTILTKLNEYVAEDRRKAASARVDSAANGGTEVPPSNGGSGNSFGKQKQ